MLEEHLRFVLPLASIFAASATFGAGDGPVLSDQKIDECMKDLQAGDLTDRELAAMALRNCGAKIRKAIPALLQAHDDADQRVRAKAAAGTDEGPDERVQAAATAALKAIDPDEAR